MRTGERIDRRDLSATRALLRGFAELGRSINHPDAGGNDQNQAAKHRGNDADRRRDGAPESWRGLPPSCAVGRSQGKSYRQTVNQHGTFLSRRHFLPPQWQRPNDLGITRRRVFCGDGVHAVVRQVGNGILLISRFL